MWAYLSQLVEPLIQFLAMLLIIAIVAAIVALIVVYFVDKRQTKHSIRRNYPVLGRFRYFFETLGEFFRQYFFALDREEFPFNRAIRSWIYRAAKNVDTTVAFGSTVNIRQPGTILFANSPFPVLDDRAEPLTAVTIGQNCQNPYTSNSIVNISAMSFGAISRPAVQALSHGAKQAGCWLNTGEGGLSPYHLEGGADLVVQIGTAKYGVRNSEGKLDDGMLRKIAAYPQVKMFEIKLSQGAKPGKGGILPAVKVCEEVAGIRGIPVGKASISPNAHIDIESIADLLEMIKHIRNVTGKPVGIKAVIGSSDWVAQLCDAICSGAGSKANVDDGKNDDDCAPDFITIDSSDGGSAAAPQAHMDYVGISIQESLPMVTDIITNHGLRDRIKIIASGKLVTPSAVAWAIACGADFVNSARGFMFSLGCIQAMQCNRNTCPTGITTHQEKFQRGLVVTDKTQRVANYHRNLSHAVAQIAHSCGVKEPRQLNRDHLRIVNSMGRSQKYSSVTP